MLHKRQNSLNKIESSEEQRSLLCSNKELYRCSSLGLSEDTIKSLNELGDVLRAIDMRMLAEGYTIIDGKIKKLDVIEF